MLQKLKKFGAKMLAHIEAQQIERKRQDDLAAVLLYEKFRLANPKALAHLYPVEIPADAVLREMSPDELDALRKTLPPKLWQGTLRAEIEAKLQAQEMSGKYEFKYDLNGLPSFHYYAYKNTMTEPERMLAAYALIGRDAGFFDALAEKQLLWIAMTRTVSEVTNAFALRRLTNTAFAYEDTREMSAIFDFGRKINESVPKAWRVYVAMLEQATAGSKAQAERLVAEVKAAGWMN